MLKYTNLYIPECNDIAAMDIAKRSYASDKIDDKCIIACIDNESEVFMLRLVAVEVSAAVLGYYRHSNSFLWHPAPADMVYRIITPDPSAIRQMHVFNSLQAVDQYNYLGNCYRTEGEAEKLLTTIKKVFKKHNLIV